MDDYVLNDTVLGQRITARISQLDYGIAVLFTGGERSHIGAAACAGPEGMGALPLPGHREDVICRQWAVRLAEVSGTQVWIACGIHYDNLSREGLEQVTQACGRLLERAAAILGKDGSV